MATTNSGVAEPKPAYDCGPDSPPLIGTTIGANLADAAAANPCRDALVDVSSGRRWSYQEFHDAVRRLASGLARAGLKAGDRVGIWAPNCPEWTLIQFATAEVGAILVTINPAYRSHEMEYVLNQAGVDTVFAVRSFKSSQYDSMLDGARVRCPSLRRVVIIGDAEWNGLAGGEIDDAVLAAVAAELSPTDPINIQYTSGTTGFPKGATLTHRNILNNGYLVGEVCRYSNDDRICIPVPFYHCFGMVMGNLAAVSHGAAMVIPAEAFDPAQTLAAVQAERCTSLYGVPTMFIAMLDLPQFDSYKLSSLRTGIMAGSPCPQEIMRRVIDRMHMSEVSICYGMTETSPVSTQTRADDSFDQRINTVGRAAPHVEVKVVDLATGQIVACGVDGELCTRGYSVMAGYWAEPEKTGAVIDAEGWMHTGDIGRMDSGGYVSVTGRIKDMVIRGGENIYPREIEEFLHTHPDVVDAQVIGVPDRKYGEELMAWLRLRAGVTMTAEDVRSFCKGQIAHYKIPRYVHVVDEYPMTVTGKVRKGEMREISVELLGLATDS